MKHIIQLLATGILCTSLGGYLGYELRKRYEDSPLGTIDKVNEVIKILPGEQRNYYAPDDIAPDTAIESVLESNTQDLPKIDIDTIPSTKPWTFHGVDLVKHLQDEHGVSSEFLSGFSHAQLVKIHSYLHNGGKL